MIRKNLSSGGGGGGGGGGVAERERQREREREGSEGGREGGRREGEDREERDDEGMSMSRLVDVQTVCMSVCSFIVRSGRVGEWESGRGRGSGRGSGRGRGNVNVNVEIAGVCRAIFLPTDILRSMYICNWAHNRYLGTVSKDEMQRFWGRGRGYQVYT